MNKKYLKMKIFYYLIIYNILQDFTSVVLYHMGGSASAIRFFYYGKEITIILIGFKPFIEMISALFKTRVRKIEFCLMLFFITICIYGLISIPIYGISTVVTAVRSYIEPFFLLAIGRDVAKYANCKKVLNKQLYRITYLIILTSFAEYFLISVPMWQTLNQVAFNNDVLGVSSWSTNRLIVNFYSGSFRRMMGTMGNPLVLSYFVTPILFYYIHRIVKLDDKRNRKKDSLIAVSLFAIQLLTLTRAMIVGEGLAIVIYLINHLFTAKRVTVKKQYLVLIMTVGVGFVSYVMWKYYDFIIATITLKDGSALTHYISLITALNNAKSHIFGSGMGSGSQVVTAISGFNSYSSEVGILNLMFDTGIIGAMSFIGILVYSSFYMLNLQRKKLAGSLEYSIQFTCIIFLISTLMSPQIFSIKTVVFFWYLLGITVFGGYRNERAES